jgi:hypothetical protein
MKVMNALCAPSLKTSNENLQASTIVAKEDKKKNEK